jgi:Ras-related protein Rab-1A
VTNKETFKNVKHWVKDVELYASENVNKAVVGNKVDLGAARQVSKQEGKVSK